MLTQTVEEVEIPNRANFLKYFKHVTLHAVLYFFILDGRSRYYLL